MMYNSPFLPHFYPKLPSNYLQKYYRNVNNLNNKKYNSKPSEDLQKTPHQLPHNLNHIEKNQQDEILFELFGIKLHSDDVLLICLIFFLYNEGIKDEFLFIALILLLLS